jgi:hypothetical protein
MFRFDDRKETTVNLDGRPRDDADYYQESDVREAIKKSRGES